MSHLDLHAFHREGDAEDTISWEEFLLSSGAAIDENNRQSGK